MARGRRPNNSGGVPGSLLSHLFRRTALPPAFAFAQSPAAEKRGVASRNKIETCKLIDVHAAVFWVHPTPKHPPLFLYRHWLAEAAVSYLFRRNSTAEINKKQNLCTLLLAI